MEISAIDKALDRVIAVINFRQTKRRSLFESECNMICNDFLEQQSYLISELNKLIQEAELLDFELNALRRSNTPDPSLTRAIERARKLYDEISIRRHDSRERRMALRRLASNRQGTDYLGDGLIKYLSDDESKVLQAFFTAIVDYYEDAEGGHTHDLKSGLMQFEVVLDEMAHLSSNFTAEVKQTFESELKASLDTMKRHRENAQLTFAEISALRDKVRIAITS